MKINMPNYQVRPNERGQGLAEYALVLVLIAVAIIAIVGILYAAISDDLGNVICDLGTRGSSSTDCSTLGENEPDPNQNPVANFTFVCNDVTLECDFDGSISSDDGTIVSYSWSFGDGTTGSGATISHTYSNVSQRSVFLTVIDDENAVDNVLRNINVGNYNPSPIPSFTVSCTELTCSVNGSSSSDDGTIVSYEWDFGDGNTLITINPTTSHLYAASGTYTVTLVVVDDDGGTASTTRSANPTPPNVPPIASFTDNCPVLSCTMASTSTDPDGGTITFTTWNMGDGTTLTGANIAHAYLANGTYTVTLSVTDNKGGVGTTTRSITVSGGNNAPTANFTAPSCTTSVACSFSGTSSSDSDGTISAYSWDFGDGTSTDTNASPTHTFASPGSYEVKLTVTDNSGATNTKSAFVTVSGVANVNPVANFTASCTTLSCTVANSSSDSDGTIASYAWTFGSGTPGTSTSANPGTITYSAAGTYSITLKVTDNLGATNTKAINVVVQAAPTTDHIQSISGTAVQGSGNNWSATFTITVYNNLSAPVSSATVTTSLGSCGPTNSSGQCTISTGSANSNSVSSLSMSVTGITHASLTYASANNLISSKTVNYSELGNTAPTANFTTNCTNLTCTISNSSSDSNGSIASYAWNFGNGTTSTSQNPSAVTYSTSGTYAITLTVTDNQGTTGTVTKSVTVTAPVANVAPTANFTVSCISFTCTISPNSVDSDGSITISSWNFGNNTSSTSNNPGSVTYASAGTFTITLTVTDDDGATGTFSEAVTVPASSNISPNANFSVSCNLLVCTITNSSTDSDGTIVSTSWNFGNSTTSTSDNPGSVTYASAGTYTITLTLTDDAGGTSTTTRTAVATAPNSAPTAVIATPTCTGLSCTFNGSGSSDPEDGTINNSNYAWNFGNGTTGTGFAPTGTYSVGGTYTVTLTVTDSAGATGTATTSVTINTMRVSAISGVSSQGSQTSKWNMTVTVTIVDQTGTPVQNATVSGTLSGGATGTANCSTTTNASGQCTYTNSGINDNSGNITFTVSNVTLSGKTYTSSANTVTSTTVAPTN